MKFLATAVLVVLLGATTTSHCTSAASATSDAEALAAATRDLCSRQIAMLGESSTHGDGRTEAFKVALVERLVNQCGFDSVVFEASHYEFLSLARQLHTHRSLSEHQVSEAVGGLWNFDREFQPLVSFLTAKANAKQISLGGIDDQLGGLGQDYANIEMVTELTALLPSPQRQDCSLAMHRRIYSDYTDAAPYSRADQAHISDCLNKMQAVATAHSSLRENTTDLSEMIANFQRWISRDFAPDTEQIVARDRSMFQNFEWLRRTQAQRHKVILWSATVHIAKEAYPAWGDHTGENFGLHLHRRYGAKAFALGFSSLAGFYRQGRSSIQKQPDAPLDSVESEALGDAATDAVYVSPKQLLAMGTAPGALFRHAYQTLCWSNFLDGAIVFREERPPIGSR